MRGVQTLPDSIRRDLTPHIRASLSAKLVRLLERPLIGRVDRGPPPSQRSTEGVPGFLAALIAISAPVTAPKVDSWRENPGDGTCRVRVALDVGETWRGHEKEILEILASAKKDKLEPQSVPPRYAARLTKETVAALQRRPLLARSACREATARSAWGSGT